MANRPFDRTLLNPLEKPLSVDFNQLQSQSVRTLQFYLRQLLGNRNQSSPTGDLPAFAGNGFVGGGFKVRPLAVPAMTVAVSSGIGFIDDVVSLPTSIGGLSGVDDLDRWHPLMLLDDTLFAVPAAPGGPNTRIDIIEVKLDRRVENSLPREILDPPNVIFNTSAVNKTLAFALDGETGTVTDPAPSTAGLSYKTGVAGNPPTEPVVTAGYAKIGVVKVGSGVVSIGAGDIIDRRLALFPYGQRFVEFTVTANWGDITVPPVITNVQAPPGVRIGAYTDPGLPITVTIAVVGGQQDLAVSAGGEFTAQVQTTSTSSTTIDLVKITDRNLILVTTAFKAALVGVGPTNYGSGLLAAVGDVVSFVSMSMVRVSNGGTVAAVPSAVQIVRCRMPLIHNANV